MTAGILTGSEIRKQVGAGTIRIEPYDDARINPASYDLSLGRSVSVYEQVLSSTDFSPGSRGIPGEKLCTGVEAASFLDAAQPNTVISYEMDERGLLLVPGIGYLMHTHEVVSTGDFVPVLDGKSSVGRLFVVVHVTAGYGDAGFNGQYTLEVVATHPVVVYPGMRFCQIRFHTMHGDRVLYDGNYTGPNARGPIASKTYRQIEKDGLRTAKYAR